jgi:hypothetical protein
MKNHLFVSVSLVLASRLSSGDHDDDNTPPAALELKSYTMSPDWNNYCPESGDSSGVATEPHHNTSMNNGLPLSARRSIMQLHHDLRP